MTRSADSKSWSMLSKMRAMKFCGWSVLDCRLYCADQGRQPSVSGGWYIERLAFTRSACPQVPAPSANPLTKKQRVPRQSAWHPRAWCRNGQGDIASGTIIDAQEYRHFSCTWGTARPRCRGGGRRCYCCHGPTARSPATVVRCNSRRLPS